MRIVEYMATIIGLNFGYLVSFNDAEYTIYFLNIIELLNCFSYC